MSNAWYDLNKILQILLNIRFYIDFIINERINQSLLIIYSDINISNISILLQYIIGSDIQVIKLLIVQKTKRYRDRFLVQHNMKL
ncbi:unnamed protein product [Commensalibacter communis]|nr:unnamed protein product [Commensalibacter communis]CAI3934508.1 unnamed protein product [Commensalibacter communis]